MTYSVVVFTDVGVKDIDDELLLQYLIDNNNPMNINVVFMGSEGVTPKESMEQWSKYKNHILEKYSTEEKQGLSKRISYHTIDNFKNIKCEFDYALQISPMNGYDGENISVKEKYVFAGDYITPEGARPSFNRQGSEEILDRFHKENKLVDIPSAHMVKMRFNNELLKKFTGIFKDNIVFTAFMLAFARMSPTHSANKFAEGLINPKVGRGANYISVMKMKEKLDLPKIKLDKYSHDAANKYIDSLVDNGVDIKELTETCMCLYEINLVLQSISIKSKENTSMLDWDQYEPIFLENGGVFVSDFDINSIPYVLDPCFDFFKKNADKLIDCFNPVYDLFAGYVLNGLIHFNENRTSHSHEEFLKNVVTEF